MLRLIKWFFTAVATFALGIYLRIWSNRLIKMIIAWIKSILR